MKTVLLILLISYLALALLLFFFQRSFIYFPQAASKNIDIPEVNFEHDGQKLTGWLLNSGQNKALIYYGGNAESIEHNIDLFQQLFPDRTVYLIPYRGYGKNTGEPTEKALYADALFVFDQVEKKHESISLIGRSLGSGVATYVAVNRSIDKLVLVTPYDSIENVAKEHYPIFPVTILVTDKFLSNERAPKITSSTLILIAENDQIISRVRSENLASKFAPELLTKTVIANADHNDISFYPEYVEAVQLFFE